MEKITFTITTDNVFRGENNKFYYFYCITHKISNKKYYGVHTTFNLNDGYKGSGRSLLHEMKSEPLSHYHKDIIKFFNNNDEMYAYEEQIVTKDVVRDKMTYNMHTGGSGSWDFTQGRVTVKDENGNFHLISVDDKRYINGDLQHNMVGLVHVIKLDTQEHITIPTEEYHQNKDLYQLHNYNKVIVKYKGEKMWMNRDEYLQRQQNGEDIHGQTKGKGLYRDKNGNHIMCDVNDERVLSGELVGITKGLTMYKFRNDFSKTCQTTSDDPRVLSGELVGLNYGMVHVINPITLERFNVAKGDERILKGEVITYKAYQCQEIRKKGEKIPHNRKTLTKADYESMHPIVIKMKKEGRTNREIANETNLTLKKIQYITTRYKNAPLN